VLNFAQKKKERKIIKDNIFSNIYSIMKFECETCYKVFYKKYNYNRHLSRKKPCKPKNDSIKNIPITSKLFQKLPKSSKNMAEEIEQRVREKLVELVREKEEFGGQLAETQLTIKEEVMKTLKENIVEEEVNRVIKFKETKLDRFYCRYCTRNYKQKYNLTKHLKKCKEKEKKEKKEKKEEKEKVLELQKQVKKFKELQKQKDETMRNQLVQLLESKDMKSSGTTNITNISGDQHNNIINITLNDYGNEDVMRLDPKKTYKRILSKILNSGIQGIQKYIQYKYCNPNQPQNLTIKYTNKRSNNLFVRQNDDWVTRNKEDIIDELYNRDNNIEEVLQAYEKVNDIDKFEEDLDAIQKRFLDNITPYYIENLENEHSEQLKEVKKETLNNFYKCYKKNKLIYDQGKMNIKPEVTIEE